MNRIKNIFKQLESRNETALVGFVTAGDPSYEKSIGIIEGMCSGGLDILELGIPFSDPTADGPVIQRSSGRALETGMTVKKVLQIAALAREVTDIPIILFTYYNPLLAYGLSSFYDDALASGADGILVVDLPPEESGEMTRTWGGRELSLIRLVAPTTPPGRMDMISEGASGFLYLISKTGVTGSDGLDLAEISAKTCQLKSISGLPVCVGFGISTPEDVAAVSAHADGVVIGSAFERLIEDNLKDPALLRLMQKRVESYKAATRPGRQGKL